MSKSLTRPHASPPKVEYVGVPATRREKPSRKEKVAPSLLKIAQRALQVTDDQVKLYQPREIDVQIVEAYLAGAISFKAIAQEIGVCPGTVGKVMKDPVVCAWVSDQLNQAIPRRFGIMANSLMLRALTGDHRCFELLLKHYGKLINRNVNVNIATDYSKMTDADLDAIIAHEQSTGTTTNVAAAGS